MRSLLGSACLALAAMGVLGDVVWMGELGAKVWKVSVEPAKELGAIRLMNAVNNGPIKGFSDQTVDNFETYAALKIPYARIHDASIYYTYGAHHVVDIHAVFPNFDADENDPANYDFTLTDRYLSTMREAGTEPYYRLGASIEHWVKKFNVNPPKDFAKWARICEHIVRHYNEGWANGFKWNIQYWEIWNEPDQKGKKDGRQSPTWTGTQEQFLELYKVTSLHLRKCFGDSIKIGGPAFCWAEAWKEVFLPYCAKEKLPLDFYSWHLYTTNPKAIGHWSKRARKLLDQNGFTKTESHLNEWNYVAGWDTQWIYSLDVINGSRALKGAAFAAAAMSEGQDAPVDMLMYYDARLNGGMNGIFKTHSMLPNWGYWAFVCWNRLRALGTQVAASAGDAPLYLTAAKDAKGNLGLLVTRFTDDDRDVVVQTVEILPPTGTSWEQARFHLTDPDHINSEIFPRVTKEGTVKVRLAPNAFLFVDWRK